MTQPESTVPTTVASATTAPEPLEPETPDVASDLSEAEAAAEVAAVDDSESPAPAPSRFSLNIPFIALIAVSVITLAIGLILWGIGTAGTFTAASQVAFYRAVGISGAGTTLIGFGGFGGIASLAVGSILLALKRR